MGVGSEVGLSGASSITLLQIARWLQACLAAEGSHRLCARYREDTAYLPARVLDIGQAYSQSPVRLHVPQPGDTGRYIALSHCWGGKVSTTTTKHNLEEYKQGIPLPLPQTFQDAVWISRALGVRYLWIDSFCIMQDSLDDWHAQAPQMATVYGNAYLTLSTDAAANSTEGFLDGSRRSFNTPHVINFEALGMHGRIHVRERCSRARHVPVHDWVRTENDTHLPKASKSDIQTYSKVTHTMDTQVRSPLSKRAWALQERVLSPRTLHFGHAETGWECRSQTDCECSPLDLIHASVDRPTLKDVLTKTPWTEVLELYSALGLTLQEDRLVALSGLAEARQRTTRDRYVAGLWMSTIKDELLWNTTRLRVLEPREKKLRRLNIAPSWSWASTTGQVSFLNFQNMASTIRVSQSAKEWDPNLIRWEVKSVSNAITGANPFSATISASIRIEGLLAVVHVRYASDHEGWTIHAWNQGCSSKHDCKGMRAWVLWDNDDDVLSDRYTFFVTTIHGAYAISGLVLEEQSESLRFRRVGRLYLGDVFENFVDYWTNRSTRTTFTIS